MSVVFVRYILMEHVQHANILVMIAVYVRYLLLPTRSISYEISSDIIQCPANVVTTFTWYEQPRGGCYVHEKGADPC
jgi:hypothetical protein